MREATHQGYLTWLEKKEWTTREASCLLAGCEPPDSTDHDSWEKIVHHDPRQRFIEGTADMWRSGLSTRTEPAPATNNALEGALGKVADMWRLIQGEIVTGKLPGDSLTPAEWISWAESKGFGLPNSLRKVEKSRRISGATNEPSKEKAKRLAQRKQTLKGQGVKNFLRRMSTEENLSTTRIKQLIKKAEDEGRGS